jgi:hypothetical protein
MKKGGRIGGSQGRRKGEIDGSKGGRKLKLRGVMVTIERGNETERNVIT